MLESERNCKPVDNGNAEYVNEVCRPIPFEMLRLQSIADFYTEEPPIISIRLKENDKRYDFEQVLRIRIWKPNQQTISWSVYSEDREWDLEDGQGIGGIVIRRVVWDRAKDTNRIKTLQGKLINEWPNLSIQNIYLNPIISTPLVSDIKVLDIILGKGISFEQRNKLGEGHEWDEYEIRRVFDWGSVQAIWHPFMQNFELQNLINNLIKVLDEYLEKSTEIVFKMDLDYSIPTQLWKMLVEGTGAF
ncbi:MAG: hypothetical protein M0T74_04025 [Desulfitobacterium hafniense]|nr:hypothetical protein [Desulfitobacterium hafniense]